MTIKVTFDTNCFFDYFERDARIIQKLMDLRDEGLIEIAATSRVVADTCDSWSKREVSPIWDKIRTFPELKIVGTVARCGVTRCGNGDFAASKWHIELHNKIQLILTKASSADIDHLLGHIANGRNIFITRDMHFLKHKEQLRKELNAVVFTPEDAVANILVN